MADPPPPENPFELHDLTSTNVNNTEPNPTVTGDNLPTTPPPNLGPRNGGQRVRFDSSDVQRPPPGGPTSGERDERLSNPPAMRRPRPALSRNPSSYNSVLDNVHDIPLSPAKAKSAADAARRAQALAADAQRHSELLDSPGFYDIDGTPEEEHVTEAKYTGNPSDGRNSLQNPLPLQSNAESENTSEARELLRAHWQFPIGSPDSGHNLGMFSGSAPVADQAI